MNGSTQPLVTIVMPVTKTRFLEAAIESALRQDYAPLEVLALNDGSTDPAMLPLLEGFAERRPERFRFVSHENVGQSATINRGVELARGELAGYLSDDDLLRADAVSTLVAALTEADAVVAYPDFDVIDVDGKTIDSISPISYSRRESARLHDPIVGAGALFRVDAFDRIGGWHTDLRYRADFDFWLRLGALGRFAQVKEALASWRYHEDGGSIGGSGLPMAREALTVIDRLYEDDSVEPELAEVRGEAYRAAFIQASIALRGGPPSPADRFFVFDRHMPRISRLEGEADRDPLAGIAAEERERLSVELDSARKELAAVEGALAQRDETIAALRGSCWRRLARRAAAQMRGVFGR